VAAASIIVICVIVITLLDSLELAVATYFQLADLGCRVHKTSRFATLAGADAGTYCTVLKSAETAG